MLRKFEFRQDWAPDRFFNAALDYLEAESFAGLVAAQSGEQRFEKYARANTRVCQDINSYVADKLTRDEVLQSANTLTR